ncbi:transglycosylase [Mycoemilia scoparia]|uniref:Transglycosylase n=1 Tax=Mycoemilia scoparia TaxID=417184 RepID=A0A9W8DTC0_9FUNG|nr:transglycosylase [Mycoemilia scoparia]
MHMPDRFLHKLRLFILGVTAVGIAGVHGATANRDCAKQRGIIPSPYFDFNNAKVFYFNDQSSLDPFEIVNCPSGVSVENGQLILSQANKDCSPTLRYPQYLPEGGMWEMNMNIVDSTGIITAFVLYGREKDNPALGSPDEIDWEFSGWNKTLGQTIYYVKGQYVKGDNDQCPISAQPNEVDFSKPANTFGIEYSKDHISWWLNGVPRRTVTKGMRDKFPSDVGSMYFGLWDGSANSAWAGPPADYSRGPFRAFINWIRYSPYLAGGSRPPAQGGQGGSDDQY